MLVGGDVTAGIVYTSGNDEITHVGGANANDAHDQIDHDLSGLTDMILEAGGSVDFLLEFSSGEGDGSGGHDLWVDNLAVSGTIIPEPSSFALIGLGGLALLRRRR